MTIAGSVEFGPSDYAGVAYGSTASTWSMYNMAIFARVCILSGSPTPSKTIADWIGMYGSGGDPFSHNATIPANGAQPFTGPAVSWQWVGLVSGKPRIWMHDGRPEFNQFGQPRNLFTGGLNGAANHEFLLEGSVLSEGCHALCFTWRWTSAVLSGEPSECSIWVDGVEVATYNFPAFASGQPGWFEAADSTQNSWTIGGTRDTAGAIPDDGTFRLGEVFFAKGGSSPAAITEAQVLGYYNACPGPGVSPAPFVGYDLTSATDLDDSIGTRDLSITGGTLVDAPGCPCPGEPEPEPEPEPETGEPEECCSDTSAPGGGRTGPDGTVTTIGPRTNDTIGPFVYTPTLCGGMLASATDPTDPQELT